MSRSFTRREVLRLTAAALPLARGLSAQDDATFSTGVRVVNLLATVRDKDSRLISDLSQDDFSIQEDGRPQTIRYFSKQSGLPLTLGLLVDISGSQLRVLDEERSASNEFFQRVLRPEKDKAFIISFDNEVQMRKGLTSSRRDLQEALLDLDAEQMNRDRRRRGLPAGPVFGTVLYDSIFVSAEQIMKKQEGRKAVILITDGVDVGSKATEEKAIEFSQRADTLVYSILFSDPTAYGGGGGFGGPGVGVAGGRGGGGGFGRGAAPPPGGPGAYSPAKGKSSLEKMSAQTGGGFFEVSKKTSLAQIYTQIEEELRGHYNLGYSPETTNPGYHRIKLALKRKGLTVRARDGYYTTP